MTYPDPFPHKIYRSGSCPDPTPRKPQADHGASYFVPPQQLTPGGPVHGGFTVIEHDEASTIGACPAHGEHPHDGEICLDCPTCRPADTNARFAEMSIVNDHLALRVQECNCGGPYDVAGDPHRAGCGWEPVCSIQELDQLVPSLPARLVREFHEVFGLPIDDVSRTTNDFRAKLIREEMGEAVEASNHGHLLDRRHVAKELADAVIALYGTAVTTGIDLDMAVRLVHESNMSKVDADGKPIIREDGKVMKGLNYREPDMTAALRPLRSET
jgi:NTP pyrophosphatase (non-canonical NTP hydrolase)